MGINELFWMQRAIALAKQAKHLNEVPVGAVLVLNNGIIAEGCNSPVSHQDPTAHAEIIALREGAKKMGNYRLLDATLYVTLEPCVMCVGAMIHARIKKLVYGADDPKTGAVKSVFRLLDEKHNHQIEYQAGILAKECGDLLKQFFLEKRKTIA